MKKRKIAILGVTGSIGLNLIKILEKDKKGKIIFIKNRNKNLTNQLAERLKKNVQIKSDNFNLKGDLVKIFFDKSLYDIKEIEAKGNIIFDSSEYKINGKGEFLNFKVSSEEIIIDNYYSPFYIGISYNPFF